MNFATEPVQSLSIALLRAAQYIYAFITCTASASLNMGSLHKEIRPFSVCTRVGSSSSLSQRKAVSTRATLHVNLVF